MKKISLFENYSKNINQRLLYRNARELISNKYIASLKGKDFYDGHRDQGMGGYKYDKRWSNVAFKLVEFFKLDNNSKILLVNAAKGYLLYELKKILPKAEIYGLEESKYAISKSKKEIKKYMMFHEGYKISFKNNYFDFIFAPGYIYEFSLKDIIKSLQELKRVSLNKKNIYITLGSYFNMSSFNKMKHWSLLGTTILKENEWEYILKKLNYKGYYEFVNSKTLNLTYEK